MDAVIASAKYEYLELVTEVIGWRWHAQGGVAACRKLPPHKHPSVWQDESERDTKRHSVSDRANWGASE